MKLQTVKINQDLNHRVNAAMAEQMLVLFERETVINALWVGLIGQLHVVLLGGAGLAKSLAVRDMILGHIVDPRYFETAVDETTDPSRVFGPTDIKAIVELGKSRVVTTGMLPEATHAFIDELFNANGPVKHSLQPIFNERLYHNNGKPTLCPLRFGVGASNDNDVDTNPSTAPFFDRIHIRCTVEPIKSRDNQAAMVAQAIARLSQIGRGSGTSLSAAANTRLTVAELDEANKEALGLDIDDVVMNMFLDIREELLSQGVIISDRRMVEGMAGVLSNAWIRNHATVQATDLDILSAMWWSLQEQEPIARGVILGAANPSEKAALDLLDEIDKLKAELNAAQNNKTLSDKQKRDVATETMLASNKLVAEAKGHLATATAAGAGIRRITEVIERADAFNKQIIQNVFNIKPTTFNH